VAACNEAGAQAQLVAADVSTDEGARKLADAASAWGRLDILVNNAGITRHARDHSDLDALSRQDFLDTYAVNVAGPFLVMQACKPLMVKAFEQTGRASTVLNISSIAGVTGIGSSVAYAATKGGVVGMTLPIARDLASLGIRCNTIAPGIFNTPLMNAAPDKVKQPLIDMTQFPKRLGHPPEYAALVCHMIENRFLNGETSIDDALSTIETEGNELLARFAQTQQ